MSEKTAETIRNQSPRRAAPKKANPRKGPATLKTAAKAKRPNSQRAAGRLLSRSRGTTKKAEPRPATLAELLDQPFTLADTPFNLGPALDIGEPEPFDFAALKALESVDISRETLKALVEARLGAATGRQVHVAKRLLGKWRAL
jgi:hypothetical protein